jgi:hypothetical protein
MLAFLDALCAALLARNTIEICRLLSLPRARQLPRVVREEAMAIAKAGPTSHLAPLQTLQLYYKLSHLVDESSELEPMSDDDVEAPEPQIELPFRIRKAG